jgi:hypothetical protein
VQVILFRNSTTENEHHIKISWTIFDKQLVTMWTVALSTINTRRFKQEFAQSIFTNLSIMFIRSRLLTFAQWTHAILLAISKQTIFNNIVKQEVQLKRTETLVINTFQVENANLEVWGTQTFLWELTTFQKLMKTKYHKSLTLN